VSTDLNEIKFTIEIRYSRALSKQTAHIIPIRIAFY